MTDGMIQINADFQYSINIAYDLHDKKKLADFIPTKSALELLERILKSTAKNSKDRAHILVGAYGKGKSHIVLAILALLSGADWSAFTYLKEKVERDAKLSALVANYYESGTKLLPVVISGNGTNLPQSFVLSLRRTLDENNLSDLMPETNYRAAAETIARWKRDFPDTYKNLEKKLSLSAEELLSLLHDFDLEAYREFERVYPELTSGGTWNPFLSFDAAEIYESVVKELKRRNLYSGIYVVYDEFSKYLEANIAEASVSDTKSLQDFAEKCCRSGELQIHLMLISHKEIANYIDKLPKQKTDGWRGISERFSHTILTNNFSQVYEIIGAVIQKDAKLWKKFEKAHAANFQALSALYEKHNLFSDVQGEELQYYFKSCYPLHPVSMFVLPRLSERIAQNERTLFTFLAGDGEFTLKKFLRNYDEREFKLILPDLIYDYFEPLLKKEVYSGAMHDTYILSKRILEKLGEEKTLACKIIKTIALVYFLEQFEKLKPLKEELLRIYSDEYGAENVEAAIDELVEKEFVVYIRQSNAYLKLKESSGTDIRRAVLDEMERQKGRVRVQDVLNRCNTDAFMYPSRYNDEYEMTRYFSFCFIEEEEAALVSDWNKKCAELDSDGAIFALILKSGSAKKLRENICRISENAKNCVFIVPKKYAEIESFALQESAVNTLKEKAREDKILFEEYQILHDDLLEKIQDFVFQFSIPENNAAFYIYAGSERSVMQKREFSELLSEICESTFPKSPLIKNEFVNKKTITSITRTSRNKVLSGILRDNLECNLGLTGFGQDVSIMRSCLIHTGLLGKTSNAEAFLELSPAKDSANLKPLLGTIKKFIADAANIKNTRMVNFSALYKKLEGAENKIGARRGIIPIYLAVVLRSHKKNISIFHGDEQIPMNAETLSDLNDKPEEYSLSYFALDSERENYLSEMEKLFCGSDAVNLANENSLCDKIADAMRLWFLSLPDYSKEAKKVGATEIKNEFLEFRKLIKSQAASQRLLFDKIPAAFNSISTDGTLVKNVREAKVFFDGMLDRLKNELLLSTDKIFCAQKKNAGQDLNALKQWCAALKAEAFEYGFHDGTDKFLALCRNFLDSPAFFIDKLAPLVTSLPIKDWKERTAEDFFARVRIFKDTAESFAAKRELPSAAYELRFFDDDGQSRTKRFDKVEESKRAQLLYNKILSDMDAMGLAISDSEKRQVLFRILQKLC